MDVNKAWENIIKHEGEIFHTVSNLEFTYQMNLNSNGFITNRGKITLTQKNFEKAFSLMPVKGPGELGQNGIYGNPYVYALLTDKRIMND